jgi:oxygen-independent coproporphyrinogen-3 oxidase
VIASLYAHIPFCAGTGKCAYCDFYSTPVRDADTLDAYVERLTVDAERYIRTFKVTDVPTLYIGGGTPSVLGAARMTRLLAGLTALLEHSPREITVEVNPESADEALLKACRDSGVTRLSVGAQSFHEPSRRAVKRSGDASLLRKRMELIHTVFGSSFSADLITGLPYQNEALLLKDIETLLAYQPEHVSLYALTVEEGTPLETMARQNSALLPPPDSADALFIAGRDALELAGYGQYEVSNFSLPGKQGAHNLRYWRMENWLGLGPAASSTIINDTNGASGACGIRATGTRYTFKPDVDAYLAGNPPDTEPLDQLTLMQETLLMGFRFIEGPDAGLWQQRFGRPLETCIPRTLAAWRGKGLIKADRLALTKEGLLFLDIFLLDIFKELEIVLDTI